MPGKLSKQFMRAEPDLRGLLLVILAGGWLAGVVGASWLALPRICLPIAALLALFLTGLFWRKPAIRLAGLTLLCLCLGAWRYSAVSPANDAHAISALIGPRKLQIQGEIADEPHLESNSTLLTISTRSISLDNGQSWQEARGQIQVQMLGATFDNPYAPHYGDAVQLTGKLSAPPPYATPEIQASMAFPGLFITSRGGNPLLELLYQARTTLAGILMQVLPQPFAALLIAIFLSLRTPALKPLINLFTVTGTAHLLAPSGFKVTLLAGLIGDSTRWLVSRRTEQDLLLLPAQRHQGNWKRWLHTLLVILSITLYTVLSGGGPAALRAGIMGTLLVLAPRLDRVYNVYTSLALTALVMSLIDPFVLWDTGFQLSFIGTLGIVLFTPIFQRFLRFLSHLPLGHHIAEISAVTLAAEIATLPIFALSFHQISFVALLANIVSVPLLGALLGLGALVCLSGLFSLQLALICGWLVWPLLWYVTTAISLCAHLPGAYLAIDNMNALAAWLYYALLAWLSAFLLIRWQPTVASNHARSSPLSSYRTRLLLRCSLALLTILATCVLIQAARPDGQLTILMLTGNGPAQGEALFLRAPDGQTALINEGASSETIAQTLDAHLPFWQRSLDLVILSNTSADNIAGLQDVVTRYEVKQVVDAGMLHPSAAYARWRDTLVERNLSYTQARQGTLITLGQQISLQVLWPPAHLHKSSNETRDNALIVRLLSPGLHLLLLDSATLSNYALQTLPADIAPAYLQAGIVQITSEQGKAFPASLSNILTLIHPSLLLTTTTPTRNSKSSANAGVPAPPTGPWQVVQSDQASQFELQSNARGWNIVPSG